jgi:hypothetical protein
VADECVAAVVDRERAEAVGTEHFAGGAAPLAERVAGEWARFAAWTMGVEE